jgi:hypothetical protein
MTRFAVPAGSDESLDGVVRAALAAAFLLVAQHVAAKATRDALFLTHLPVTALPVVSAAAAGISMGGVFAFSRAMARSSPPVLLRRLLAASAVLLACEWVLARVAPRAAAVAVYVHVGLFGATLVSGFWSVVNERFDPHAARRVIGHIGTGAALGGVAGGLLTWQAAGAIGLRAMLLVLAGLTLASLAVLGRVTAADERAEGGEPAPPLGTAEVFALIRRHAYLRRVGTVVALCAVSDALLDYVLNAAAAARYGAGAALPAFFALYHSGVAVGALVLQALVARPSLERLGLAGTLAVQPALLAVGGLAAALAPGFWPRVALRATQAVLANSLVRSAYELLYTPLPPQRKRPAKALLDVGADRGGTIVGSVVVMLVLALPAGAATRVLLLLAAVAALATLVLTRRLHTGYVAALADSLRAGTLHLDAEDAIDPATRAALAGRAVEPPPPRTGPADEAADLRSHDAGRVRAVLASSRPLPPELIPLVLALLGRDDVFTEAVGALRRVGVRCTGQLLDALLDPAEDPVVRRRVPRVLKAVPTQRAVDGLLVALRDERFDVRYRSAQALLRLRQRDGSLSVPEAEAMAAARRELAASRPTTRGLDHVVVLLSLALPGEPLRVALRAWRSGDRGLRGTALEYFENVLPPAIWAALSPWLGPSEGPPGRTLDEVRDDLLRSTRSWTVAGRSRDVARRPE